MNPLIVNTLLTLASIGLMTGPALLVLRWNIASPIEAMINIGSTFALGLIILSWLYFASRTNQKQPQAAVQESLSRLQSLRKAIVVYVLTMGSLVTLALYVWLTRK